MAHLCQPLCFPQKKYFNKFSNKFLILHCTVSFSKCLFISNSGLNPCSEIKHISIYTYSLSFFIYMYKLKTTQYQWRSIVQIEPFVILQVSLSPRNQIICLQLFQHNTLRCMYSITSDYKTIYATIFYSKIKSECKMKILFDKLVKVCGDANCSRFDSNNNKCRK